MEKLTFGKEINLFFKIISENKFSIVILLFLLFLAFIFITTNKKNVKTTKKIYIGIYSFITIFLLVFNFKYLGKFFDYMMNNFFIAIYFPNFAIYFAAIIISNIIVLISIFDQKITKLIKNINIIVYTFITYLLILLIGVISKSDLDVYSQASIYKNTSAHALISLTSTIFMLWIIFLVLYTIIKKFITKDKVKEELPSQEVIVKEKIVKERILPDNIKEVPIPAFATVVTPITEEEINKKAEIEIQKRVNTRLRETHQLDNMLSKKDYMIILKMLKDKDKYNEASKKVDQEINENTYLSTLLKEKQRVLDNDRMIKEENIRLQEEINKMKSEMTRERQINDAAQKIMRITNEKAIREENKKIEKVAKEEIEKDVKLEKLSDEKTKVEKVEENKVEEPVIIQKIDILDDEPIARRIVEKPEFVDDQSSYLKLQALYESVI